MADKMSRDLAERRVLNLIELLCPLMLNLIYKLYATTVIITGPLQTLRMEVGETIGVYAKILRKRSLLCAKPMDDIIPICRCTD